MGGRSKEAVVKEYKGLQMHLNPRNSILSKMMVKTKLIFKLGQ